MRYLQQIAAFAAVLNRVERDDRKYEVENLEFTVEEKIDEISNILETKKSFHYSEIIHGKMSRMELVCIFLALLETVKKGMISIKQHKIFGDIYIMKRKDYIKPEQREEGLFH